MPKFRKNPVVIEAFQLTAQARTDNRDWPEWLNRAWNLKRGEPGSVYPQHDGHCYGHLCIATLEGEHLARLGDWIIQGVMGELYPCKAEIFSATYDPADQTRKDAMLTSVGIRTKAGPVLSAGCYPTGFVWISVGDGTSLLISPEEAEKWGQAILRLAADARRPQ